MSWVVVDVEADGPVPGLYSMVSFGAVIVDGNGMKKTFYGEVAPISKLYKEDALAVSGHSRKEHEKFDDPEKIMIEFVKWVKENSDGQPVFWSDNNGFDWMFMCYYMWTFAGENPFGWSSRRIGDLYCGLDKNVRSRWKHLRETKHTHHPVDDARGNGEALIKIIKLGDIKVSKQIRAELRLDEDNK